MARLIDVEGVLRDKVWFCGGFVSDDFSMGYMEALDKVETVIRQAPTVDAVPVVHGRWCWQGKFRACSKCGSYVEFTETLGASFWKFCPFCGAKMDGGENNA